MKKYSFLLKQVIRILTIGATIGLVVALFQFCMVQLTHFLQDVFVYHVLWKTIAFFIALPILIFYSYLFTSNNANIRGGGIPQLENNLKHHPERLQWIKDLPMMFFSSLCSFCAYGTLGAEGPSVVLGGNSALMINAFFHEEDNESVWIGAGAAFGCAFQSPIAGFVYCVEELLEKITLKGILKTIGIVFMSYLVIHFLFPHATVSFEIATFLTIDLWYFVPIIVVMNFIFGTLFVKGIVIIKDYLKNHPNSFYNKYKVILFYVITIALAFFLGKYMGSGSSFLGILPNETLWYVLLGLSFFRLILTIHGSTSSVSGGIVIPQLAIGGAVGMFIIMVLHELFHISLEYAPEVILLSMLSFYVVVMETPFTGIALIFAFVPLETAIRILPFGIVIMFLSRFISFLNRYGDLYDILKKYL